MIRTEAQKSDRAERAEHQRPSPLNLQAEGVRPADGVLPQKAGHEHAGRALKAEHGDQHVENRSFPFRRIPTHAHGPPGQQQSPVETEEQPDKTPHKGFEAPGSSQDHERAGKQPARAGGQAEETGRVRPLRLAQEGDGRGHERAYENADQHPRDEAQNGIHFPWLFRQHGSNLQNPNRRDDGKVAGAAARKSSIETTDGWTIFSHAIHSPSWWRRVSSNRWATRRKTGANILPAWISWSSPGIELGWRR